jgi:hypothetical protein
LCPLTASVRSRSKVAVPLTCASWATGELVPPGQARMVDTWSDYSGCWANVFDDDHEEMQACEGQR